MMGVFAAAVARLTPAFVESFDPEKLAAKFVRVEKEFGVKFTKSNSTFNIVGHWEAVREAHKSLLKLNYNEKTSENCREIVDICNSEEISATAETPLSKKVTEDCNDVEVTQTPQKEQVTDKEPVLYRGKGNPKRGRHATKESPYSDVPEPVFYLQYQDKTFTDACRLDIDSVLEDFQKSHNNEKVTKEDLRKVLEKNKDQMGKPLENGIPKGAILPMPKVAEENYETFAVEDMLNPIPPSTHVPSDIPTGFEFGTQGSSKENTVSIMSNGRETFLSLSGAMNTTNHFNNTVVTTNTAGTKMSLQKQELVSCINGGNIQRSEADGQLILTNFFNQSDGKDVRLPGDGGIFTENQFNVNDTGQDQFSDSDSDSLGSMFGDYDPQAMLNQIPDSEMRSISEVSEKSLQQVDTKVTSDDKRLLGETSPDDDNERNQKDYQNSDKMSSYLNPPIVASDSMQYENNKIKMEYQEGSATLVNYTELPVSSKKFTAKDFSQAMIQSGQNNPAVENTSTNIIAMAIQAAHDGAEITNVSSQNHLLNSRNSVVSSTKMIQNNPNDFYKSMPTGEEFMKSLEGAVATENHCLPSSVNEQHLEQAIFQSSGDVSELKISNSDRSHVTMRPAESMVTDFRGHQALGNVSSDQIAGGTSVYVNSHNMDVPVKNNIQSLVPKNEIKLESEDVVDSHVKSEHKCNEEQDQEVKVKNSKPAAKRVCKKKVTEKSEKHRVKKSITPEAGNILDGNDDHMLTNTQKTVISNEKDHVNKLYKQSVEKIGKEVKGKQVYKCTECDYQGYRKKRLSEHMGRVHGLLPNGTLPENPMFSCDECEKTFVFEKDLSRHKKIVHHGQVFVCLVCNKNYKSKYVYDRHTATHVEGYVQPKFKCQICEQEFTTKFSLSSHIKSKHLGVKKTYSCPTCGKTFSQIRSYRQHANVHAGIRPYTCEVCGKSFTYDKSLKEHRYMHDSVRRFQCTVCQKAFRQQTCLLIHMKTHKDKKDHICSVCGREFTQKQSLLRHERIHTGDKPYSCKLCFKSFGDYAVIRKHIMMAHKADKDSWKEFALTTENKRSSHYIDGGPGYVPRESYAKINEKPQENVNAQMVSYTEISDSGNQRIQPATEVVMPVNNLIPVHDMYQVPSYTANLDFRILANSNQSQVKSEDSELNIKPSVITGVEPYIFENMNAQQQNLTMKSYLSNFTANTLSKINETDETKYAQELPNTSDLVYNVAVEKATPSAFTVKDELLSSSVYVCSSDPVSTDCIVTVASTSNSWTYPGYSSAYFSPSSFSPYQNSPDTPQ